MNHAEKESAHDIRNKRICPTTFFQTMLDHNAPFNTVSIQYHLSLGRYFKNNKYVIAKVRCFLVKWWCSSNKLKVLLLDLSFPFLLISLNLKSIKISMFKYFVFIRILILLFFKDFLVYLPLFKFCRESYNKRIFSL